jgi:hypothetical protein
VATLSGRFSMKPVIRERDAFLPDRDAEALVGKAPG